MFLCILGTTLSYHEEQFLLYIEIRIFNLFAFFKVVIVLPRQALRLECGNAIWRMNKRNKHTTHVKTNQKN